MIQKNQETGKNSVQDAISLIKSAKHFVVVSDNGDRTSTIGCIHSGTGAINILKGMKRL